ncbi:hypothetical protein HMPREF3190_00562 [Umbribacter vaginalis]|nr:hypothetical protein HMPREF3190_00562 [Coriobacteriales bacterium DNF00809]
MRYLFVLHNDTAGKSQFSCLFLMRLYHRLRFFQNFSFSLPFLSCIEPLFDIIIRRSKIVVKHFFEKMKGV